MQLVRLLHRTYMDTQLSKFSVNTPDMLTHKLSRSSPVGDMHNGFERTGRAMRLLGGLYFLRIGGHELKRFYNYFHILAIGRGQTI